MVDLFDWDVGVGKRSPGLRQLHKLTPDHVHLKPATRMRVYMAAQVRFFYEMKQRVYIQFTLFFINKNVHRLTCFQIDTYAMNLHCTVIEEISLKVGFGIIIIIQCLYALFTLVSYIALDITQMYYATCIKLIRVHF